MFYIGILSDSMSKGIIPACIEDVQSCKKWINNRVMLENLVYEMISVRENYTTFFKSRFKKI